MSDVQTCRYCAERHAFTQCKDTKTLTLKCVNCEHGHSNTSRLCLKKLEAMIKVETSCTPASKRPTLKQSNRKPAPIPLTNAWATLTVQEVEKRTFSRTSSTPLATTSNAPKEVSTKQPTARNSVPKAVQNRKVVTVQQQITNIWTKPFVPSIKAFPVATSAN